MTNIVFQADTLASIDNPDALAIYVRLVMNGQKNVPIAHVLNGLAQSWGLNMNRARAALIWLNGRGLIKLPYLLVEDASYVQRLKFVQLVEKDEAIS